MLPNVDVPLTEDVFHYGQVHEDTVLPVLYRRSYIDDVNFGDATLPGLKKMLRCLLESFRYWRITISLPKSAFAKRKVDFLSHEITREGIKAKPKNLESILTMPFPRSLNGVQKFIGCLV